MPDETPILIDCDTGVDDALALMLAAHSPELSILGVTSVAGNISSAEAALNSSYVLRQVGRPDVPVVSGAAVSLGGREPDPVPHIHGPDGLGGVRPGAFPSAVHRGAGSATDFILSLAREMSGKLTIVATGPLTNIALALRADPRAMRSVGRLIVMGGALRVLGNITPHAEFNVHCDPLAFGEVMSFGIPTTLFPLDVTETVTLLTGDLDLSRGISAAKLKFLRDISDVYRQFHRTTCGADGCYVHDALTIAWLIDPSLATLERGRVEVETAGKRVGKTHWTADANGHIDAAVAFDGKRFFDLFWRSLSRKIDGSLLN
jgi:inosine-uridine nucleoside N-ribohydrolase